jgi:hypothetical protein
LLFTAIGCKKEPVEKIVYVDNTPVVTPAETGTVELIVEPTLDGTPYTMGTEFTTPAGEKLKVTDLRFLLSSIGLASENSKESKSITYPGDLAQNGIYLANLMNPNFDNGHGLNSYKMGSMPTFALKWMCPMNII